jgi:hypothetical protein
VKITGEKLVDGIPQAIASGVSSGAVQAVQDALASGIEPLVILNDGIMSHAEAFSRDLECGELFLPGLMQTTRALRSTIAVLTPVMLLYDAGEVTVPDGGDRVFMATILTDIHDIGKNTVSSMLSAVLPEDLRLLHHRIRLTASRLLWDHPIRPVSWWHGCFGKPRPMARRHVFWFAIGISKYGDDFPPVAKASSLEVLNKPFRSPKANGGCEWFLGRVRT